MEHLRVGGAGNQEDLRDKCSVGGYLVMGIKAMESKSREFLRGVGGCFFFFFRKPWNVKKLYSKFIILGGQGDNSEGKGTCCPD